MSPSASPPEPSGYETFLGRARPGFFGGTWGDRFFAVLGGTLDLVVDATREAVKASLLTHCTDDALPYHAAERGLDRAAAETNDAWRGRMIGAWDAWQQGGTKAGIEAAVARLGYGTVSVKEPGDWPGLGPGFVGQLINGQFTFYKSWSYFWVTARAPVRWGSPKSIGGYAASPDRSRTQGVVRAESSAETTPWAIGDGTLVGVSGATQDEVRRLRQTVASWSPEHARCISINITLSGIAIGDGFVVGGPGVTVGGETADFPLSTY